MTTETFGKVLDGLYTRSAALLCTKGKEYARGEDRLAAFKKAAAFSGTTPRRVLFGYMLKHITSLFDLNATDEKNFWLWNEKIVDTINYLCLLQAILIEEVQNEKH